MFYAQQTIDGCNGQPRMKDFFHKKNYCNFFLPSISCEFSAPFIPLSLNLTKNECSAENDDTESIDFFFQCILDKWSQVIVKGANTHTINPVTFQ